MQIKLNKVSTFEKVNKLDLMTSRLRHYLARSLLWKFGHPKFWLLLGKPVGNAQPSYINLEVYKMGGGRKAKMDDTCRSENDQ